MYFCLNKKYKMNENVCIKMLQEHGVKPTSNRIVIVKALAAADYPMSMKELENVIITIDKSNIFRALTLFKEHHLVHVLEDGEGDSKYELCFCHDEDGEDDDEHVHFYCEKCHKTFCFHEIPIPSVPVPVGYQLHGVNFMLKGICPDCSKKMR